MRGVFPRLLWVSNQLASFVPHPNESLASEFTIVGGAIVGALAGWLIAEVTGIVSAGPGAGFGALAALSLMLLRFGAVSRARRARVDDAFDSTLAASLEQERARSKRR